MNKFQWPDHDSVDLICQRKWMETSDSVSITLAAPNSSFVFDFIPGQFVILNIELDGKTESRAYSLSSSPNQTELQLTIKRVTKGKVSNYLIDHFNVGQSIRVMKPSGKFHINQPRSNKITLLSAGCGITPIMSMARTLLMDEHDNTDICFIHAATCLEQIIYHDELRHMAKRHPRFQVNIMLEDASGTQYLQGRLTPETLLGYCSDIAQRSIFLCGPVGFMEVTQQSLKALNVDMNFFYQESFTPKSVEVDTTTNRYSTPLSEVSVFVPDFNAQTNITAGHLLIDALETMKIPIIAACRSGMCGACRCRITKGEFTRISTETLSQEDQQKGYVLACSCQVHSDVDVSLT